LRTRKDQKEPEKQGQETKQHNKRGGKIGELLGRVQNNVEDASEPIPTEVTRGGSKGNVGKITEMERFAKRAHSLNSIRKLRAC